MNYLRKNTMNFLLFLLWLGLGLSLTTAHADEFGLHAHMPQFLVLPSRDGDQ
jgi:hypothetical protein